MYFTVAGRCFVRAGVRRSAVRWFHAAVAARSCSFRTISHTILYVHRSVPHMLCYHVGVPKQHWPTTYGVVGDTWQSVVCSSYIYIYLWDIDFGLTSTWRSLRSNRCTRDDNLCSDFGTVLYACTCVQCVFVVYGWLVWATCHVFFDYVADGKGSSV